MRLRYTHVLWDFNGTILNDVEVGIKSVNTLLHRRGLPLLNSVDDYHEAFTFPVINYYRKLGFDFDNESYDDIAIEWVTEYLRNSELAYINDGVVDALKAIAIPQIILSASELNILIQQLTDLGIIEYFAEVLGLNDIKASSKITLATEWVERIKPESAVLIGDTVHDYETASAIGIDCILINGGHQNKGTLLKCGVPVLNSVREVIDYLL